MRDEDVWCVGDADEVKVCSVGDASEWSVSGVVSDEVAYVGESAGG